jgi:predicted flavoprotein YhiN
LGLTGAKTALLFEVLNKSDWSDPARVAACLKALPLSATSPRPLAEAISTAGGVSFTALSEPLMLHDLPGVFIAGEMLDWEAPTGGYLLNACLATGRWAGLGAAAWLAK